MSIYKSQQQFEEWFAESRLSRGMGRAEKEMAWETWQVSRLSLVISLPKASSARNNEVVKAVGRSIVEQGIKVDL